MYLKHEVNSERMPMIWDMISEQWVRVNQDVFAEMIKIPDKVMIMTLGWKKVVEMQ